jgi:hypothetical protein
MRCIEQAASFERKDFIAEVDEEIEELELIELEDNLSSLVQIFILSCIHIHSLGG